LILQDQRRRDAPALLKYEIDQASEWVGGKMRVIGNAVEERPILKYGFVALDVVAGPSMYLVREGIGRSPLGQWVEKQQERALGAVAGRFEQLPGYSSAEAGDGAVGVFGVSSMTMFGAAGLLKRLPMVDRLLSKLPRMEAREGMTVQVAGADFGRKLFERPRLIDNPKHIPGNQGYHRGGGTQPPDAHDVFGSAITKDGKTWFARSPDGKSIYRYTNDNGVAHWSGSTRDASVPLNSGRVPSDILKDLGFKPKGPNSPWK
jgi:hypothetical protein